ncbi:MAG: pyrimidine dimer DNA glycosylase/endonuclease V [archaeon]
MVRINLLNPEKLSDQHLIAEYNEILMLLGHVKKFPEIRNQPKMYTLGKGHINFFKDKLFYLKKRHEKIKKEMKRRGFKTNKKISLNEFGSKHKKPWLPTKEDFLIIKKRIKKRIGQKPNFYRHYGEKKSKNFFHKLMDD